jgi:hypothetical protein
MSFPLDISLLFGAALLVTLIWFYFSSNSKSALLLILAWAGIQSVLALTGIFTDVKALPPKLVMLGVFPAFVIILIVLLSKRGKAFISQLNLKTLTWFHSIRVIVEIVLALLYHQGLVPVEMTFEGRNFDILSGLSAGLIAFLAFRGSVVNSKLLIGWNLICLALLLNIIITAALAAPSPFQQLAFNQPNVAVLYFPFSLLPTVVVPLVLFAHFAALYKLFSRVDY